MEIPTATYRIQFNPDFGFQNAIDIVPYLTELGISHIYASPIFKARKGSPHGYDGVDPNRLNPELGSSVDFEKLIEGLQKHGMGWLQDIVPNHLAFDYDNRMLMDVLENGSSSKYYTFFDIEWNHPDESIRGRLLAPFLGRRYIECLENGEIKLRYDAAGFTVTYYNLKLPLRVESYLSILVREVEKLKAKLGEEHPDYSLFIDILDNLESLSLHVGPADRYDQVRSIKQTLWDLYCNNAIIKRFIEQYLRELNGEKGNVGSFNWLNQILSRQLFRLCFWKVACEEINYRRFFDINELIAICQEKEAVFDYTHALLRKLIEDGIVSGVRIDHIDGLGDPTKYLKKLRERMGDVYILVEKILDPVERLPDFWPVQGTTGYEFTNMLSGLFIQQENEEKFTTIYTRFSGLEDSFEQIVYAGKRQVLASQLAGDLDNLACRMKKISNRKPYANDLTFKRLKEALAEVLARFPVYRTYINHDGPRDADRQYVHPAVELSVLHQPHLRPELAFIQELLLDDFSANRSDSDFEVLELVRQSITQFQQLTAPLMAKGFEDTALYVYNRFISLNEVGGEPGQFGCSVDDFHAFVKKRADRWPHTMNSTATHDSKRAEDVRARINVLSELPEEWENHLKSWCALNRKKKIQLNGEEVPDQNEEYLLYQTLLGAFPFEDSSDGFFIKRIGDYLVKAVREAKIHSSWIEVNKEYEAALVSFARKILHPAEGGLFLKAFLPFFKKVAFYGIWNTLSQTLLKITTPGVADFYQGTELFDFHLVDPDNRRPVDFEKRKQYLAQILNNFSSDPLYLIRELLANRRDGRIKLFLIARALRIRNANAALFQHGSYVPLAASGKFKAHVIAFARTFQKRCSITVVPRFLTGLVKENQNPLGNRIWRDTEIIFPEKTATRWKNIFTAEILSAKASLKIGNILRHFPCALLIGEDIQ